MTDLEKEKDSIDRIVKEHEYIEKSIAISFGMVMCVPLICYAIGSFCK